MYLGVGAAIEGRLGILMLPETRGGDVRVSVA
jgi:hypothetical protein